MALIELLQGEADRVFLALVAYREARGESYRCKLAVIYSILNRVARPSWWGGDVMSVVTKKWQYSSMTAPGDPNLVRWPRASEGAWQDCLAAAYRATIDIPRESNPAPNADSYYDISIPPPRWADPAKFVIQIGRIRFYNLDQDHEPPLQ